MGLKVIRQLVRRGADVNITTTIGSWTLLHKAVSQCRVKADILVIQYLIRKNVSINGHTSTNENALHLLVKKNSSLQRTESVGGNRLLRAARRVLPDDERCVNIELFRFLVNVGCDVDKQNDRGQSPRNLAVEIKCHQMVKILSKNGADVCARDLVDSVPEFFSVLLDNPFLIFVVRSTVEELRSRNSMMSHVLKLVSSSMPTPRLDRGIYQLLEEGNPHIKNQRDLMHRRVQILSNMRIDSRTTMLDLLLMSSTKMSRYVRRANVISWIEDTPQAIIEYRDILDR
ncbi:hypothetical protein QAD02_014041 [Eretmocerus hayati]|uniref:Uncharacterized protein n=1 Tax=Eretmocerus hayati TaxID=131215 RepID=A0ACC2P4L5_9HYME|nr:hypothetical protein QAD02_014041 [Eretmocerus hayati]